jgi:dTDP-4-amino-4,6-dideoxygalactose transaminase
MNIPVANPLASYRAQEKEFLSAVKAALESGRYIHGEQCGKFESEFAAWNGNKFAVGVGNGTQAIEIALRALNIGAGDEVITVSHTAVATVAAIELTGASAVLVDIDPHTLTLDPSRLKGALSPKTKAVVAVHVYGSPCDMDGIGQFCREKGLFLIEDCAQAHGAKFRKNQVGTMGILSCFSFYPTKNLGAFGDGGAVLTDDPKLAARCRELREYGWRQRYISETAGLNSRLDEIQAAFLRVKLAKLTAMNDRRIEIASRYLATGLDGLAPVLPRNGDRGVYHLFVVRPTERAEVAAFLEKRGVLTAIHYPMPVHLQPAYAKRLRLGGDMKVTEGAAKSVLSLPLFPELTDSEVAHVASTLTSLRKGISHAA